VRRSVAFMPFTRLLLSGTFVVWHLTNAQAVDPAGRRVIDVIAELREQGIEIIYSDELLTAAMRVGGETGAADPIEQLRLVLRPHGLGLTQGPRGSWLVVRVPEQEPEAVEPGGSTGIEIMPPRLEEIVVSASRYAFSREPVASTRQVDRTLLENAPTLGEDALRATHSLPGLTSSGLSARINVRGGASDEALLYLDGVQLLNPFHLKDFQSLFSGIDPKILDSMAVFTGAFPARFGNRMSAVVDMQTIVPEDRLFELGISTLTSSVLGAGSIGDDRGGWLFSARRGNLDLLIDAANSDLGSPEYVDLFGKLDLNLSPSWTASIGALALRDEITLNESDSVTATADYDDDYFWIRLDNSQGDLDTRVLFSVTEILGSRFGSIDDPVTSIGELSDVRRFESTALKADWEYALSDTHHLSWGLELRKSSASYRYAASRSSYLPIQLPAPLAPVEPNILENLDIDGEERAVYASYRTQAGAAITAELGLRWDEQPYLHDRQLSPRLNVLFDLSSRASLRMSWGRYAQTQRLDELQINNGLPSFLPAQESEHLVVGLEYLLGDATSIRVEGYRKEFERLQPRAENLFARVSLLPELLPDRVLIAPSRGEATGLEFSVEGEFDRWRWWLGLSRSRAYDVFGDTRAARSWEEPWSLKSGAIRAGERWTFSVATTWHSGWPISALELDDGGLIAGPFNAERFGEFGSVDLRLSRDIQLERSRLQWFVSLNNLFGRENACCIEYEVDFDAAQRPVGLELGTDTWLSTIPSFGFIWRFSDAE
jgi:hypothetical protein